MSNDPHNRSPERRVGSKTLLDMPGHLRSRRLAAKGAPEQVFLDAEVLRQRHHQTPRQLQLRIVIGHFASAQFAPA